MRFLLYSHDGMGLGHTRRHLAIAAALNALAPDASILVATGADEVNRLGLPPQVEVLKLPALRKLANESYASRRLRIPTAEIRSLRSALLAAAVGSFKPSVVLVDKHPLGAGGEFRDALERVIGYGGIPVLGLRDILDAPDTVRAEWSQHELQQRIAEHYHSVLVYGQKAVFDPITEYKFSKALAERTQFCGYIVHAPATNDERLPALLDGATSPVVLATAGGGEDGYSLLETFARAARNAPWTGVIVPGPMIPPDELAVLQRIATESGVALQLFVPELSNWFWSVNALVCMGGYNTLAEALCTGTPTVCVPRVHPRREQLIRASSFEKLGLLRCVPSNVLTTNDLAKAIRQVLTRKRANVLNSAAATLNFDGARQAAGHLLALAKEFRADMEPART